MKLATWNINSARARVERILDVLERHDLDVLALQEIKCKTEQFPGSEFTDRGYQVAAHGVNQWNGVALISRLEMTDVRLEFPHQPGFTKGIPAPDSALKYLPGIPEARAIGAKITGVDIWSLYVPNGRAVNDPHYFYKLDFLAHLQNFADAQLAADPQAKFAFVGDWNVIPTDQDVWDPAAMPDGLYLSDSERAAFDAFHKSGMREVSRDFAAGYTFWDYQKLRFPKNEGMRIDYVYASPALADCAQNAFIDRDERKGQGASDHVPVIVDFK
ncbi:exodeoxyribonuclease III [Arcanobacterium hippocoleae]|uniref:Exodeoxyribonuclease-3 n=1 Tax=Arcanobacterium hippocoleae TaxID=149017 RepID=A0ABU1T2X2_9ACTO|nr:exodeoxyribonuclease III [Arcanobacterium hippocoleae]MDR6939711.1 exodeoxyribonuclease-3 [Arcanobacterium hippocoleae]